MEKNIVSARVCLIRNIKGYPFYHKLDDDKKKEVRDKIKEAFFNAYKDGFRFIDMESADRIYAMSLAEKGIVNGDFLNGRQGRAVILSEDNTAALIINADDHINIRVTLPDINKALEKAKEIEEKLAALEYAYSDKLGYLTADVKNLGTAMKASLVMHLPAITDSGAVGEVYERIDRLGLNIRAFNSDGRSADGLYRLSNRVTLGVNEADIIGRLTDIAKGIVKTEDSLLSRLKEKEGVLMEDKIMRACGTLKYAKVLSARELPALYSLIRTGFECEILDTDIQKLDGAYFSCRPATIALECGEDNSALKRDMKRAEKIKNAI